MKTTYCRIAAPVAAALIATPAGAFAQSTDASSPVGTIVIAHGAGEEWNAQVKTVVSAATGTGGPVEIAFLMGPEAPTYRFQDAVTRLAEAGVSEIVAVPLLVSSNSGHYEQIRYLAGEVDTLDHVMMHHLEMAGIERVESPVPIRLARAIDDSPDVARVLADRARALVEETAGRALFLVGHGPNSMEHHAQWMKNLRALAEVVQAETEFQDIRVGVVQDDAPAPVREEAVRRVRDIIELQAALTGQPVVVVPVLISKGRLSDTKLPADLEGMPVVYSGEPLLPHPSLARWIEARVREASEKP